MQTTTLPNISIVKPSAEAAERFARYYERAFLDDNELAMRMCDPESGINGLTEIRTAESLLEAMEDAQTL